MQPTLQPTSAWMDRKRDEIAEEIWRDYQEYLHQHGVNKDA